MESVARHLLPADGTDAPYEERVALYRAGIRLYLRLIALHLARQTGRIPSSDEPANDRTLQPSIAVGLTHIDSMLSQESTGLPGPPQGPHHVPLYRAAGEGVHSSTSLSTPC